MPLTAGIVVPGLPGIAGVVASPWLTVRLALLICRLCTELAACSRAGSTVRLLVVVLSEAEARTWLVLAVSCEAVTLLFTSMWTPLSVAVTVRLPVPLPWALVMVRAASLVRVLPVPV